MKQMQRDYLIQQLQAMRVENGRNGELLSEIGRSKAAFDKREKNVKYYVVMRRRNTL